MYIYFLAKCWKQEISEPRIFPEFIYFECELLSACKVLAPPFVTRDAAEWCRLYQDHDGHPSASHTDFACIVTCHFFVISINIHVLFSLQTLSQTVCTSVNADKEWTERIRKNLLEKLLF